MSLSLWDMLKDKHENPRPIDKKHLRKSLCPHGSISFCCKCAYGERSHYNSKKGMLVEKDVVDFMAFKRKEWLI